MVLSSAPNSNEAKILRTHYQKILNRTSMPTSITCTHIKVTGVRCASPSLRGEQFCYFHQHAHRGVRKPPQSRLHPIAILEDEESIQSSLMEVINALMRNTIDLKRAELILRALHIAVKNARRVKFDIHASDTVKEIPNYAAPSNHVGAKAFVRPSGEAAVEFPAEEEMPAEVMQRAGERSDDAFPPTASIPPDRTISAAEQRSAAKFKQEQANKAEMRANLTRIAESLRPTTTHVGTAAPGCSSGPAISGRSAATTANAPQKKPPVSANEPPRTNRKHATAKAPK
jgi:hypothetical protein